MRIKQVIDHPDYCVSDAGNVFTIKPRCGLVELQKDISNGYPRVQLDGKKFYVSSLVAAAYLKPPEDRKQKIFFIDGDKTNCSANNLCWLSPSDVQRYSQYTTEYRRQMLGEW